MTSKKFLLLLPAIFLLFYTAFLYNPLILQGLLPIPADTIVGLYHPWRDAYSDRYPNGIPFKNFLITDPVRQQYPWRQLAIDALKKGNLPKWDPYNGTGTPLLANIQAAAFYPLNFLYWLFPFATGWSIQVVLQTILGGIFMILYLHNLKISPAGQAIGTLAWVGSGFFIAWLEWNTLVQVALFLPLLLINIDKKWPLLFIFALTSSFFAGHLQIFLYILVLSLAYALYHRKLNLSLIVGLAVVILLTSIQWLPILTLFKNGVRSVAGAQVPGWFLPWQNLVQFVAPDFFGNPATLNYFGIWNYGEFVAYIGLVPLLFALLAIERKNIFWVVALLLSLFFALPNPISQLPPQVIQPTRLLVLADFSLAVLAASGLDDWLKGKKNPRRVAIFLLAVVGFLWLASWKLHLFVSQKNLILPTALLLVSLAFLKAPKKVAVIALLALTLFDLTRFAGKFESFSKPEWLYPQTQITRFLEEKAKTDVFRVASLDSRIFPPNFSVPYRLQMVSVYDSIILANFAHSISPDARFNRIIEPGDPNLLSALNVKYILTFGQLPKSDYQLVFQEGQTKVYENKKVLARVSLSGGLATIKKYSENEVTIATESTSSGTLVLRDNFYPDWHAEIDGQPTKISEVENLFRGLTVPAGSHLVRFFP